MVTQIYTYNKNSVYCRHPRKDRDSQPTTTPSSPRTARSQAPLIHTDRCVFLQSGGRDWLGPWRSQHSCGTRVRKSNCHCSSCTKRFTFVTLHESGAPRCKQKHLSCLPPRTTECDRVNLQLQQYAGNQRRFMHSPKEDRKRSKA